MIEKIIYCFRCRKEIELCECGSDQIPGGFNFDYELNDAVLDEVLSDETLYCSQCGANDPLCVCGPGRTLMTAKNAHALVMAQLKRYFPNGKSPKQYPLDAKTISKLKQMGCNSCPTGKNIACNDWGECLNTGEKLPSTHFSERKPMSKHDRLIDLGIRDQFMEFKKNIIRRVQAIPHSGMLSKGKQADLKEVYRLLGDIVRRHISDPRPTPEKLKLLDIPGKK